MATYPLNKERINYSRLCRAIVDVCTDVFRDILVLQRRLNPKDLETELKKCADFSRFKPQELTDINTAVGTSSYKGFDITMLYQIFRVLFTQDLRDDLMATVTPSQICTSVQNCSALSTGQATKLTSADTKALIRAVTKNSYDELEDDLLWKLYSQLCSTSSGTILIHPTKLWGKNPAPVALTLGDDIERIRILRNTVYGHIKTTEVSDVEFNRHWTSLENIAIRIDSKIGTGYKKSLDDIKISSLDLGAEKKFFDQLKKLAEDLEQNVSDITTLKERQLQLIDDISSLKTENTLVNTKVDEHTTELHTLRIEQEKVATGVKTEIAIVREEQGTMAAEMKTDIATCREEQGSMAVALKLDIASCREEQGAMAADLKTDIATVREEQGAMAADLKTDIATCREEQGAMAADLKTDIATCREEQGAIAADLKTDIAICREEQGSMAADIKTDIATVREEQGAMAADIASVRADQEVMITDLKTEITTVKSEQGAMAADLKTDMDTDKYNLNRSVKQIKAENKQTKRVTTRLQRDVGQLKSSFQDPVPVHLRQRYNVQLEEWEKEDDVFTETRACRIVRNAIDTNTFVTVFGNAGSGKSAIVHHLALEFKSIGYDVLPVKEPDDIEKYLQIDQKQLFVYDDPVGVHCINRDKFMKWLDFKIESPEMTKNLRVLCSIRRQIVNESDFKSNCNILNKKVIDIQDDKNKLTLTEKIQMIRHHIDVRQINLTVTSTAEKMINRQEESFPLVCKLFVSNTELHKTNDWTFFQNPFKLVLKDLEKMKLHDKIKYCIIILCLVSKNRLDPELYTPDNTFELTREKQFINACGLTCESIIAGFQNGVESLVNVYLKWQNGMLSLSHDLISDVISYHFGQKYPKLVLQFFPSQFISRRVILGRSEANDPYVIRLETKHIHYLIDRMLIDFEKREFKNVFMNKCWSNDEFLDTFKATEENKIGGQPGKISPPVLEIFTEPQQPHKDIESEIQQISDRNIFSTWTWYYLALYLLKIPGVTALHWIATFGHGKLFTYVWDNLSWDQKAHVVHKIPLLHFSCLGGEMEIFNLVLQTESNKINTSISSGVVYPIHLATFHDENIVQTLIKLGADINVKDCVDHSALFYAVSCNNIKNLNILIHSDNKSEPCKYCGCYYENKCKNQSVPLNDNEFNLNQRGVVGRSPLFIAAILNKTDVAELLLLNQAAVNLCDEDGYTPLHTAAIQNSADVANILLQHQANVNLHDRYGDTPLYTAVTNNSVDVAKLLLLHQADVNFCDEYGRSPLHTAARSNSVDVAKLLLLHQANVNLCNKYGYTALLTAATYNSVDVAKLLILHQADVNLCGEDGYTPLHTAARKNSVDVAKLLILHQANVNLCDKYRNSPLHKAASNNSVDVAKLLLLHQADVNLCDKYGRSPLHTAALCNSVDVAKLLLLHQADVNLCDKDGDSPLHTAALCNSVDVAKLLILHQADVNLCNKYGYTALLTAASNNSVDVAKLLILHQADVNLCGEDGYTPLLTAAIPNSVDVAKLLILHQADVNLCGEDGYTPLHTAALHNSVDVAKLLILHQANVNLCNKNGDSPLHTAARSNSVDVAKLLILHQANVNLCNKYGYTPLLTAASNNSVDVAKLLILHQADVNLCGEDGYTPLHTAARKNSVDVAKLLILHQADVNLCDKDGRSPLYIAARHNSVDVAKLLILHQADVNLCDKDGRSPLDIALENRFTDVANLLSNR